MSVRRALFNAISTMKVGPRLRDRGAKAMSKGHKAIVKVTGGRLLGRPFDMQGIELRTTGRKSGRPRSTMLSAPIYEDARVVLVASYGGDDRHPDWYRNLVANPDIEVAPVGGPRRAMQARTASPDEKAQLWPTIVAAYKGYDDYQRLTHRDIPVVICEPADARLHS